MTSSQTPPRSNSLSFVPRCRLANGHVMTVFAWARKREFADLPAPEPRLFQVTPDTQVLAHCFWQTDRAARPTLVALHGLEGSSEAHYMRGLAAKAWRRGWNAVLLNQRNCGGTEHLTPSLYHSGLTPDPLSVIRELVSSEHLERIGVVGYSLGGNLTLRLAGEVADGSLPEIKAVVAVSPTIDLDTCVHAIERRSNYPYQWNFVRNLKARLRRKVAHWPGLFDLAPLGRIWTIRGFDAQYTAPHHGFKSAEDYYFRASALRVVDRIAIPTLIISAEDDPFVPASQFNSPEVVNNLNIQRAISPNGGHCGFVADATPNSDGYWAEDTAVAFLAKAFDA